VGILIPVIPLLLTDPGNPYYLAGISVSQGLILLGLLTAIYPFMQFLATPILGQLSDHYGRRPVLAFSLFGTSLSYAVFAIGIILQNIPLLFISRAVDGITGGNISVAQAAIADSSPPEKRARHFGAMGAAFGIGFIIGPFLGGKLSDPDVLPWFSATTPFWFAAILALLNMLGVLLFFRETLAERSREAFHLAQALINVKLAAASRKLRKLYAASFLFQGGFAFFTTFIGAYVIERFRFDQGDIGTFFAFVGICVALTQALVTGPVGRRFRPHAIISTSLFGVTCTIAAMALVPTSFLLYALVVPQAVCVGLIMANLTAIISRSGDADEQGSVLGIAFSVQALAQSVPPAVAGVIAAHTSTAAPILVGSVFAFLGWLLFAFFTRTAADAITGHA
jgi:DHA1 family tetracycline resistance protein-like MFS transporter